VTPQQRKTLLRLAVACFLAAACVGWLLYTEGAAVAQGGHSTISELVWLAWAQQPWVFLLAGLVVTAVVFFLLGHFTAQTASFYEGIRRKGLLVALLALPLLGAKGCGTSDCDKAREVVAAVCGSMPASQECAAAQVALEAACQPKPTPPPPPPTTLPGPPPTTLPPPPTTTTTTTLPPAPQPVSACPASCLTAEAYINSKPYGNGWDSTIRLRGSAKCCADLGHDNPSSDCHLEGYAQRTACERELAGGCPVWQYQTSGGWRMCLQPDAEFSCSHWGDPAHRDDPMTPQFEGEPKECGLQRDRDGLPMAGYFVIAHGKGSLRACLPKDEKVCSGAHAVNY
jgi:hypothetical protein